MSLITILGLRPKPRRSGLAILNAFPLGLRYRLMAIILGLCPKHPMLGTMSSRAKSRDLTAHPKS